MTLIAHGILALDEVIKRKIKDFCDEHQYGRRRNRTARYDRAYDRWKRADNRLEYLYSVEYNIAKLNIVTTKRLDGPILSADYPNPLALEFTLLCDAIVLPFWAPYKLGKSLWTKQQEAVANKVIKILDNGKVFRLTKDNGKANYLVIDNKYVLVLRKSRNENKKFDIVELFTFSNGKKHFRLAHITEPESYKRVIAAANENWNEQKGKRAEVEARAAQYRKEDEDERTEGSVIRKFQKVINQGEKFETVQIPNTKATATKIDNKLMIIVHSQETAEDGKTALVELVLLSAKGKNKIQEQLFTTTGRSMVVDAIKEKIEILKARAAAKAADRVAKERQKATISTATTLFQQKTK